MNAQTKTVQDNSHVTLHYGVEVERESGSGHWIEVVSTFGGHPATFWLGQGQLAPTLEHALWGMQAGEQQTFVLSSEHAFGVHNPELVQSISLSTLTQQSDQEEGYTPGDMVEFNAPGGGRYAGTLQAINGTTALFDFNHPLAGKTIRFQAHVIGVL